jgi:hypothetical protein
MYEWFTSRSKLKDGFKYYIDEESSHFQGGAQPCPILFDYPEVRDIIIEFENSQEGTTTLLC